MDIDMKCFSKSILVASAIVLSACNGSSSENNSSANSRVIDANLEGTWTTDHCDVRSDTAYYTNGSEGGNATFEGSLMTVTEIFYEGPNCTGDIASIRTLTMDIDKVEATTSLDGEAVTKMDHQIIGNRFTIYNEDMFDDQEYSLKSQCGGSVALGVTIDESECSLTSSQTIIGVENSWIYQVSGDRLYIRWGYTKGDYPSYLDKPSAFQFYR